MMPKKLLLIAALVSMGGHLLLVSLTGFVGMGSPNKTLDVLTVDLKESLKPAPTKRPAAAFHKVPLLAARSADAAAYPPYEQTVDLDSLNEEYTPYLKKIKRKIEQAWSYPEAAKENGEQGVAVAKFSLNPRGTLVNAEILSSSGYRILDETTLKAITNAAPFAPFPDDFHPSVLHVIATFQYRLVGA